MDALTSRGSTRVLHLVAAACAVALLMPWPGSLSVVVSRSLATGAGHSSAGELLSQAPLLTLALAAAVVCAHTWVRRPQLRPTLVGGVVGVGLAYGVSEAAKVVLAQPRPCSVWALTAHCPPAGDWSLPSNHATLAFAAAVLLALVTRSTWATILATTAALLVAAGRVLEGVHYLHDVALGAAVGGTVTIATVILARQVSRGRAADAP